MVKERIFLAVAGLGGALSVGAGAVAQHLLAGDPHRFQLATISARYGLWHAAALVAVAALAPRGGFWVTLGGWLFAAGIVLFCGSLDLMAAGAPAQLAFFTPWGGSAFIIGWLALFVAALRPRPAH